MVGDGGAVRESLDCWASCLRRCRLRRESDLDWDTSGSLREISVEMDLTRLSRGRGFKVDDDDGGSSSVERDFTRLVTRGRCEGEEDDAWLGDRNPGMDDEAAEMSPREPGEEGEWETWKAGRPQSLSSKGHDLCFCSRLGPAES